MYTAIGFTRREAQAVTLLMQGHTQYKDIAAAMNTNEQVIKNRFWAVFQKAGCHSRLELVVMCWRNGGYLW